MVPCGFIATFFVLLCCSGSHQFSAERPSACYNARVCERDVARAFFQDNLGWQRPIFFAIKPILVNVSLIVSSISEIIEKDRTVRFIGHLSLSWIDQFHSWAHSFPHNCVDYVVLKPGEKIWIPDLSQAFSENKNNLMAHPGERIRIHNDGYASFTPGGAIQALCEFDLSNFPFDYQKCTVRLESWKYTHEHLRLSFSDPAIILAEWRENDLWRLVSWHNRISRVVYNGDADNAYDRVEFIFMLKRKASFYVCSIVIPNYLLSLCALSIFALPFADVMRLQITFTCLFAHSLFQLFLTGDLPRSSDNYPLLAIFVDLQMFYVAVLIIGQCCVFLFLKLAAPDNEKFDELDVTKLESQMAIPIKFYNSVCIFGKILRIDAPFSMVFNDHKQSRSRYSSFQRQNSPNLLPQNSQQTGGFFGTRLSFSANNSATNLQSLPDSAKAMSQPPAQRNLFWLFACPPAFGYGRPSGNAAEQKNGDIIPGRKTNGDGNNIDLLGIDVSNGNTNGNGGGNGSGRLRAPSIAIVSGDQTTLRLLVDFRRKLWQFYARVVDRLALYVYICCIVLTPLFMGIVSASTWRDVTK